MTTNASLRAHALCSHPVTKAARAKCRKQRGVAHTASVIARDVVQPAPKLVIETCCCGGRHRAGWTMNALGVWVCADCDRPSQGFVDNVLLGTAA